MIDFSNRRMYVVVGVAILLLFLGAVGLVFFGPKKKPGAFPVSQLPAEIKYPSQVVDLSHWKLTLPVQDPADPSIPLDIFQPQLATYDDPPWFMLAKDKKGVVFRSPVNAPTTSNTNYSRSELREMADGGKKEKFWSTKTGTHTLFLEEAITAVPKNKPEVVAGQIHGDDDDLLVIRLEYPKLYITRSKSNVYTLDDNYVLGKKFTVKFVASDGKIAVYYNNGVNPAYTLSKKVDQAYFKAGVYTQSNCETENSPDLCNADNFGEVIVYKAVVTHD